MNYKIKVGAIVTDNENKILLIKEKTEKTLIPMWNIIKGTHDRSESVFEAVIREAKEEAGVKIELTRLLGVYVAQKNNEVWIQFVFIAKIESGAPSLADIKEQSDRNEYISELKWFTKEEIEKITPEEFISSRTYSIINDWLKNVSYPIDSVKEIDC